MLLNTFLRLSHGSLFSKADSKDGAKLIRQRTKSAEYMAVFFKLIRISTTRRGTHTSVVNIMYSLCHLFVRRTGKSVNHKFTFPGLIFFSKRWDVQYFFKREGHTIKWFFALTQPVSTEPFPVSSSLHQGCNGSSWTFGAQNQAKETDEKQTRTKQHIMRKLSRVAASQRDT